MTAFQEPPLVDLDEILDEQQEAEPTRVSPLVCVLIAVGGLVGVAGLLSVLVLTAPAVLDLATWINAINRAVNGP